MIKGWLAGWWNIIVDEGLGFSGKDVEKLIIGMLSKLP
jgi:hypothetical protein